MALLASEYEERLRLLGIANGYRDDAVRVEALQDASTLSAPLRSARRRAVCNAAAACCGDVSSWHIADIDADDEHVGFWG